MKSSATFSKRTVRVAAHVAVDLHVMFHRHDGPFITMPRKKRVDSVKRHRQWQQTLDKDESFDRIFKE